MGEVGGLSSSNMLRFTGLATGIDTDSMIKKMLAADKIKVTKVVQGRQTLQWKQELYRDIIKDMSSIKNKYFDVLSSDYILSGEKFLQNKAESSNNALITATAYSSATEGTYKIKVNKLARAATTESSSAVQKNLSDDVGDLSKWQGSTITFDLGGTSHSITLGSSIATIDDLVTEMNTKINAKTDLSGKIYISKDGNQIKFNTNTISTVKITDAIQADNSELLSLTNVKNNPLNITKYTKLNDLGSFNDNISFNVEYNGKSKTVTLDNTDGSKTINDLMIAISNTTEGNVIAKYSELTGKFTMMTSNTGSASSIKVTATGGSIGESLLKDKLNITLDSYKFGLDSEVEITSPGSAIPQIVKRANNNFSIDGISYNLNSESTEEVTLTVKSDPEASYNKIKGFIDDYNKMIDKIYKKVEEKKNYSYTPLTEEQKKDMSKEEIEKWESKAKEGIIKNDSDLQNMLIQLRSAFFTPVEGAGINFDEYKLGIGTSSDALDRGKIVIKDEQKFKENIKNNGEQIMRLFVKASDTQYSRTLSIEDRQKRNSEEGIFNRISDILNDYISPMRDGNGRKAPLLEKAGIENDVSFFKNELSKQIEEKDKLIKELTLKMNSKEEKYYQMFARLEKAMNGLNAQSNWLYSQMGMGN